MWNLPWNSVLLAVFVGICLATVSTQADDNGECTVRQFKCSNNRCISLSWLCDEENDCHDANPGSDEMNCTSTTCGAQEFRCKSDGRCVPLRWRCDGGSDCIDSSDEDPAECKSECDEDEYHCADNVTCIKNSWLCDGVNDCTGGEDEKDCDQSCHKETEFQCKNGNCISNRWVCDQNQDCMDGSDEEKCPEVICGDLEFNCTNKKCIQDNWVCDGDDDCGDMSDEQNCDNTEETCRDTEFQCKTLDRLCLHISWRCDGDDDCEDRSDEANCNVTCKEEEFLCGNNYCIHNSVRCDGSEDCLDGSDEKDCAELEPAPTPTCPNNTFDCFGDGQKCIDYSVVCDKWNDCGNFEDERTPGHDPCFSEDPSKNPCNTNNGGCHHLCFHNPEGRVCGCHSGFELAPGSKTECVDINECQIAGTCSQECENTKGSYKCHCVDGYSLEHNNYCKATDGDPQLLLACRKDLRRLHLRSKSYTLLLEDSDIEGAVAMDYHFKENHVYWSDVSKKHIKRVNTKTGKIDTVIQENIDVPDGLAVDWVHGNLYWTDSGLDVIEVSTLDGTMRKTLIYTLLDDPRAISLYPSKGLMFWTDWGQSPKIERCSLNGNNRQSLIEKDITWPYGLTIDYVDNRLYWTDAKTHEIGSSNLDGSLRKTILRSHEHLGHPFAITVFEDYLYWSDWPTDTIFKFNKFQKDKVEAVAQGLEAPKDIHIFHAYIQTHGVNNCGTNNGGCEHFCLPESNVTITCVCKNGFTTDPKDNKKCIKAAEPVTTAAPATTPSQTAAPTTLRPSTAAPATQSPTQVTTEKSGQVTVDVTTEKFNGTEQAPVNVDEGMGQVVIIVIAVVIFIATIIIIVAVFVFRRHRSKNIKSMNFDNPVYRKTTTDDDVVFMDKSSMQPLNPEVEVA